MTSVMPKSGETWLISKRSIISSPAVNRRLTGSLSDQNRVSAELRIWCAKKRIGSIRSSCHW